MSSVLGKIGILGPGGAGKSRLLVELVNKISGNKYPWDEEKNFIGSLSVTPFHILFPLENKTVKCTLVDNPGQNSIEKLRINAAKSGSQYTGLILVIDSTAWNFREVALWHAKAIQEYMSQEKIPINIIINKSDLAQLLLTKLGNYIGEIIEEAFSYLKNYDKIFYFNRVTGREEFFQITFYNGWVPFTQVEQFLTNTLDSVFMQNQIMGFTQVNIRILIRSILLGFCDYYREFFPDYINSNPIFNTIDEELVNSLNYFRGTSYETSTPFSVLASQSKTGLTHKKEIPFHISTFEKKNIVYILHRYVITHYSNFLDFINKLKISFPSWDIVNPIYTNSITPKGLSSIEDAFSSLFELIDKSYLKQDKKDIYSYENLGLSDL
ncbi:MAG: hypothetical protein HeimC3_02060 [Candidatus Heimdallarchaeota archaeon LC_3]|nr:MAG: hypothetical protein HeimC3_02060 [Candidatus Heimdallarchaeota archaeon LC_3]